MPLVVLIGVFASIIVAYINGNLFLTRFSDYSDDAEFYNARALSLLNEGSFHEERGIFRRPPAYPIFLAVSYAVFGKRPLSAWVAQIILFIISLVLVYRISTFFLESTFMFLPSLCTAVYWGVNFYVFKIGPEIFALFLVVASVLSLLDYARAKRRPSLLLAGIGVGILMLTKPIVLFLIPLITLWLLWASGMKEFRKVTIFFLLPCIMFVGGWSFRTYVLFGEFQAERSGHILFTRGLHAVLSYNDIGKHVVASITGDFIADKIFPGYGAHAVPLVLGGQTKMELSVSAARGISRSATEDELMTRGIALIRSHLFSYLLGIVPLSFDLHTPENVNGFPVSRMFVGTRGSMIFYQKIGIIMLIRLLWYFFLAVVAIGAVSSWSSRQPIMLLLLFILFFIAAHGMLVAPIESRFLVPVLPFYFLFFAIGIRRCLGGLWQTARA